MLQIFENKSFKIFASCCLLLSFVAFADENAQPPSKKETPLPNYAGTPSEEELRLDREALGPRGADIEERMIRSGKFPYILYMDDTPVTDDSQHLLGGYITGYSVDGKEMYVEQLQPFP